MFGKSPKLPAGFIKYFGLTDWWLTAFTVEEREKIVSTFQPLGGPPDSLTAGDVTYSNGTAVGLLSPLAGWFRNAEDRSIAYRIIEKAEKLASQADVLERHFLYQAKIQSYYPFCNKDDFALPRTIEACEQQIKLSLEAAKACVKSIVVSCQRISAISSWRSYGKSRVILNRRSTSPRKPVTRAGQETGKTALSDARRKPLSEPQRLIDGASSLPRHNHPLQLRLRTAPIFEDDDAKPAPPIAALSPQPKRQIGLCSPLSVGWWHVSPIE
jgi:hypothetical protein